MDASDYKKIRQLFDDYLVMYASRDDHLTTYFSDDFSGFTGGGDVLVKDREEWVAITRQDFAQVKEPLRIELKDLAIQSLADTIAVATGFFAIHLPVEDNILSRETARLVLIFRMESSEWKISHSSISIPYHLVRDGEVYPLQELTERNRFLEELVAERTLQLSEANDNLLQKNEELAQEIIKHKQTEGALRVSETSFRLLTENADDVVWRLDANYCFTYINPSDERLRGYKAYEVIGHHVFELFNEEGKATVMRLAKLRQEAEQQGKKTGTMTFEAEHRCKNGSWLWVEVSYTPDRDADGAVVGFFGISRETTQRKRNEDKIRQDKAVAEEASKAKSLFLATMSHEIRTPLNAIVGFSNMARKTTDPARLEQYHTILEQSSHSLMDLVNDILDMSKIEAGRMEFEAVAFNLRQLVCDLEEQYHSLAGQKGLVLRIDITNNVPVWILSDPVRLRQILANLLSNAVKFTETGAVSCSVRLADCPASEDHLKLRFEVRDTGIGIPDNMRSQLFEPFRQLDPTISRKFGGSGLGLAIVHRLVLLMNGSINVDSVEGNGSCFVVELPFRTTEPLPVESVAPHAQLASRAVLVVEDNEFNRCLLGDILISWGQQAILVADGFQALRLMEQQRFDLVLLDIRMPGIDGIEVARRIRSREQERSEAPVPIIAITADVDVATREACRATGIDVVLTKPVIPEQLAAAIAKLGGTILSESAVTELLLNVQTRKGLGSDPERIRQYREMLLKDVGAELQHLHAALERDDRTALGLAAHTLKGLCGQMENSEPAKLADWMQQYAPSATREQLRRVLQSLQPMCQYPLDYETVKENA